jgi:hypothetical protein
MCLPSYFRQPGKFSDNFSDIIKGKQTLDGDVPKFETSSRKNFFVFLFGEEINEEIMLTNNWWQEKYNLDVNRKERKTAHSKTNSAD